MNLFVEVHSDLPREGPGSIESTRKAFSSLISLPQDFQLLEIGCGPGLQSIELSKLSTPFAGSITATDINTDFLKRLTANAKQQGIGNIRVQKEDMFNLSFENRVFDVVWIEGAIFIIGFEKGLREWKPLIGNEGYIVASEISWLTDNPPEEAKSFWDEAYPSMKTIQENINTAKKIGFEVESHFTIPQEDWVNEYYGPMEQRIKSLQLKYEENNAALSELSGFQKEIDIYKKYSESYGYVFYTMKKKT